MKEMYVNVNVIVKTVGEISLFDGGKLEYQPRLIIISLASTMKEMYVNVNVIVKTVGEISLFDGGKLEYQPRLIIIE